MRFVGVTRRLSITNVVKKLSRDEARVILNVPVGVGQKEVHNAYLKQAKLFHPDTTNMQHPLTGQQMTEDEKRLLYDRVGDAYNLLVKGEQETPDTTDGSPVDGHELSEHGYPKVASIAYAKHILGVEPDATEDEIKSAYTAISLRFHPDLIDDDDLPDYDHFKLATEAYKTFMNQKVLSTSQLYYEDVIPDTAWTIQGRDGVNKVRKHDDPNTFLGRDMKQWRISNYFEKWSQMGQEMREQQRNPRHTSRASK